MTTARRWTIEFSRDAQRSLERIRDKRLLARIDAVLAQLESDPRPHGCIKLSGHHDLWRIRAGDWRIVYAIQDIQLLITVVEIQPRGSVYRNL